MMPSDLRPALTITLSFVISTTVPVTIDPGLSWVVFRLCSKSSAKLSVMGTCCTWMGRSPGPSGTGGVE
jgi:hypothetical protein